MRETRVSRHVTVPGVFFFYIKLNEFAYDRREKKSIIQKFNQTATLQSEFELLRETLLHEQSRASALEVEKRTPVRIHPWRTLQVSHGGDIIFFSNAALISIIKTRFRGIRACY